MREVHLKRFPEEFVVTENFIAPRLTRESGSYSYLLIRKSGWTTIEAVHEISRSLKVPDQEIGVAGLKDEDGVTEQLISIKGAVDDAEINIFNSAFCKNAHPFIRIQRYGIGDEQIKTGNLLGNSFRVSATVEHRVPMLAAGARILFSFLNYYGVQRFGVPEGKKVTHKIGAALEQERYGQALEYVVSSGASEGEKAKIHVDSPEDYFAENARLTCLYLSAIESFRWNSKLSQLVLESASDSTAYQVDEDIHFRVPRSAQQVLDLASRKSSLPYRRNYPDISGKAREASRPTVCQTFINCIGINEGESGCTYDLAFSLPSGSYATVCLLQFFN